MVSPAGANAYWSKGEGFADIIGLTVGTVGHLVGHQLICIL